MGRAQILVNLGARVSGVPAIPAEQQGGLSEFNTSNWGHSGGVTLNVFCETRECCTRVLLKAAPGLRTSV